MHAYCPHCPHCQREMRFASYRTGDYTPSNALPRVRAGRLQGVYQSAVTMVTPQPAPRPQWEKRAPALPLNLERAFVVPSLVALGSGVFAFMLGASTLNLGLGYGPREAFDGGTLLAMASASLSWGGMVWHAVTSSTTIEQSWGDAQLQPQAQDATVDGDPDAPTLHRYEILRRHNGGYNLKLPQLPVAPQQLHAIATGILAGRPFSEREWASSLSATQFRDLRNELIDAGLMAWKVPGAPQQGVTLTDDGRDFFEQVAQGRA